MEMPFTVHRAIKLIWITLGISVVTALINQWTGSVDSEIFVFEILIYAVYCIIPYKLAQGSNAARYTLFVLTALGIVFVLGMGFEGMAKLDIIVSIVLMPVELYIIHQLLQPQSNSFFAKKKTA